MELPLRPGGLDRTHSPLLALMLAGPPPTDSGHAQSNRGGMGMPFQAVKNFPQYLPFAQVSHSKTGGFSSLSGNPSLPRQGGMAVPHKFERDTSKNPGHLWPGIQSVGQSRPHANDGKEGPPSHRRHTEGRVDAACGKIRSTSWSLPVQCEPRRHNGLNLQDPSLGFKKKAGLNVSSNMASFPLDEVDVVKGANKRARGSMNKALEVAKSARELMVARHALTKDFWAASTVQVKRSRRVEVLRLAAAVADGGQIFPLGQALVEGVAAALKAGGMASANLYLQELKLAHIESGYDLEAWLARTFTLCGKSLSRNRGPVKRAPEVAVDLVTGKLQKPCRSLDVPLAGLAYAWGVAWMLREVELSKVKWEHLRLDEGKKWVRLFLPTSKTDQQGLGVSRTLRCCGEKPCWKGCAWHIAKLLFEIRDGLPADAPSGYVFCNKTGSFPTKAEMVKSWVRIFGCEVKGHSARRSGAMAYTRRGMTIQDLSYLGRWKSGVVLQYAEEALESVPANSNVATSSSHKKKPKVEPVLVPEKENLEVDVPQVKPLVSGPKHDYLWVRSAERGCTAVHLVDNAAWERPMDSWSTACGWHFARKSSRFSFVPSPSLANTKCKKCLTLKRATLLRDDVKEAFVPAQSVADGLQTKLKRPGWRLNQTRQASAHGKRVEGGICTSEPMS